MKKNAEIIDIEALKSEFGGSGKATSMIDLQNVFNDFITKQKVERISRIRDVELDRICRLMYFGIRHTAILNSDKNFNFSNLIYAELNVSSLLEYTMINLSLRLSLDSQSRMELKDIITSLVGIQLQKEMKEKQLLEEKGL